MRRFLIGVLAVQMGGVFAATCLAEEITPPITERPTTVATTSLDEPTSPDLDASAAELPIGASPATPRSFGAAPLVVADSGRGDGRRTFSAFPRNVARGLLGVLSRDNAAPLLLGAGLAFAGHSVDGRVASALEGRCLSCGRTGATMGGAGIVPVVTAFFVAGRFAPQGRLRAVSYDAAQAMVVNAVWTGVLKSSLHRTRPDGLDRFSLPSGHTSNAFALATVAERHYGWKVGVAAYSLASCVGLSRVESNRHHLSDVLAGATLGLIVGRTVARVDGEPAPHRRTLSLGPATDAHGRGAGLQLSAGW